MRYTDLRDIIITGPMIEGSNLRRLFSQYLTQPKKQLEKWVGTLDEVMTAKIISSARKKGLIEELFVISNNYGQLYNICWNTPCILEGERNGSNI